MQEMLGTLPVVRTVATLRRTVEAWRQAGDRIALVPTMGALHRGHLALLAHGRGLADRVVASVFVNPTQFGPNEDYARYPRDLAGDAARLGGAGCDLLYAPDAAEMYPEGFLTSISAGALAERLCGRFRPGHFSGVATVVTKLFLQARPDAACFGEKDYQQLQIIRRVARDLDIETRIEGVPTLREEDGLALSSRNAYLSAEERQIAPALHRTLAAVAERAATASPLHEAASWGAAELIRAGFAKLDYLEICDAETLAPLESRNRPGRVLAAAWLGKTRLIDNLALPPRGGG